MPGLITPNVYVVRCILQYFNGITQNDFLGFYFRHMTNSVRGIFVLLCGDFGTLKTQNESYKKEVESGSTIYLCTQGMNGHVDYSRNLRIVVQQYVLLFVYKW